ncbi:hypothetical protein [Kribbella sp. NPDC049584]|uniref:hypothetical protein n=1 Tax=Kribbella sp. NPDC049584 TaxID=3154833 RepID=UPI003444BA36
MPQATLYYSENEDKVYAYIRRYRVGKGAIEDLITRVESQFAAQISARIPGQVSAESSSPVGVPDGIVDFRAVDTGDRTVATITTFSTQEQYAAAQQGAEEIRRSLADFEVEVIDAYGGPVRIARVAR